MFSEIFEKGSAPLSRAKRLWRLPVPPWLHATALIYSTYILGLGLTQILTCIGKFTVGRLRPHFLAVCQPAELCSGTQKSYQFNYTCTGDSYDEIEARLSFPSGHASLSFFAAVYLVLYLQSVPKLRPYGFIQNIIQFLFIVIAWWVALTRVKDYWHHPTDVLAGTILGICGAILTIFYFPTARSSSLRDSEEQLPLRRTDTGKYSPTPAS